MQQNYSGAQTIVSRAIFPRLCPCLLGKPIGTHQWFFLLFQFLRDPAFLLRVQEYIPLQISGSFQGDVWKGCQFVHRTSNTGAVLKSLKFENVCIVLFCVRFEEQKVLFQKHCIPASVLCYPLRELPLKRVVKPKSLNQRRRLRNGVQTGGVTEPGTKRVS